ncbi:hypothetical protein SLE2022_355510 [Rubroshorea leprosula]
MRNSASQGQKQGNHAMYGATATQGSLHPQECAPRCTARYSATAHKKPCMFFCRKCCAKCLLVLTDPNNFALVITTGRPRKEGQNAYAYNQNPSRCTFL